MDSYLLFRADLLVHVVDFGVDLGSGILGYFRVYQQRISIVQVVLAEQSKAGEAGARNKAVARRATDFSGGLQTAR